MVAFWYSLSKNKKENTTHRTGENIARNRRNFQPYHRLHLEQVTMSNLTAVCSQAYS